MATVTATATQGGTAAGAILSIKSGGAFVPILQIKTYNLPEATWGYDDVTNSSSPTVAGGQVVKEYLPTSVDPKEATFSGIFKPSDPGQLAVADAFASGAAVAFTLQLKPIAGQATTGNLYSFTAYVQSMPVPDGLDAEKAAMIKINLKLNTIMTVTPGA